MGRQQSLKGVGMRGYRAVAQARRKYAIVSVSRFSKLPRRNSIDALNAATARHAPQLRLLSRSDPPHLMMKLQSGRSAPFFSFHLKIQDYFWAEGLNISDVANPSIMGLHLPHEISASPSLCPFLTLCLFPFDQAASFIDVSSSFPSDARPMEIPSNLL